MPFGDLCWKKIFSRKGAKAQRKPFRSAAALCAFAPLRERSSRKVLKRLSPDSDRHKLHLLISKGNEKLVESRLTCARSLRH
jgi:hypothetical protein